MPAQSNGRQLCLELATLLAPIVGARATIVQKWLPSFAKADIKDPLVTLRPAGRRLQRATKGSSDSEITVEIGVIQQLPESPRDTEADPYNLFDTIDPLDQLAEDLVDVFGPVESPALNEAEGIAAGRLADVEINGYRPIEVEQPTIIGAAQLKEHRQFLTVIAVTYQKRG